VYLVFACRLTSKLLASLDSLVDSRLDAEIDEVEHIVIHHVSCGAVTDLLPSRDILINHCTAEMINPDNL
jgi:hypothetical protein